MRIATVGALAAALTSVAGCGLTRQSAPPLSSPSSFATTVTLRATPDRLTQDGVSSTTISAEVIDAGGKAITGLALQWNVTASDGRTFVEPSEKMSLTDGNGRTSVRVTSPPAPADLPATPLMLTISATPVGDDSANNVARLVRVTMVPPLGTPPINQLPVARFTMSPSNPALLQEVTFDASDSTDEGAACMGCTYTWDFGDGNNSSGVTASHQYTAGGTFIITLTVRDSRGGVGTATKSFELKAPTAPVTGKVTFSPAVNSAGSTVFFDAGGATVGTGGRIDSYTWIWNDGKPPTMTQSPQTSHVFDQPGTYNVRVIVTDNFGRTATIEVAVPIT